MRDTHSFHIPVMGTGFSIDTPIKVAQYGISSVISLVDDLLIEQMRQFYCEKEGEEYVAITSKDDDFRARRITKYLNLVDKIVKKNFEVLKNSAFEVGTEITKYFELLPDSSSLKGLYLNMLKTSSSEEKGKIQDQLREQMRVGDINVNIMTKLDRPHFTKDSEELPKEFSDALSALRGYAQSTLSSAIVFSAGFNRRLYTYAENFKDFYADAKGEIKKKIIVKVSDYRSSITQGKFFAKKGLWVSEYRVESGLNCGGHVFPAAGALMGPILEEFRHKKEEFIETLHNVYNEALAIKEKITFPKPHYVRITAQGGIGTAKEDQFLLDHYKIDGTGWATPFLLVPEVTNVDDPTLDKLLKAEEDDLYTSDVSPVGVPFNNLRGCISDMEKENKTDKGRPGSSCPKSYLVSNTEFTKEPICTASRFYQKLKIDQLDEKNLGLDEHKKAYFEIVKKACICSDLGGGVIVLKKLKDKQKQQFPAICPGPNLAYFNRIVTLREMVEHIYGKINILNEKVRPHMFIKEIIVNIEFLKKDIQKALPKPSQKQMKYFQEFKTNLLEGIDYYRTLIAEVFSETQEIKDNLQSELKSLRKKLQDCYNSFQSDETSSP